MRAPSALPDHPSAILAWEHFAHTSYAVCILGAMATLLDHFRTLLVTRLYTLDVGERHSFACVFLRSIIISTALVRFWTTLRLRQRALKLGIGIVDQA